MPDPSVPERESNRYARQQQLPEIGSDGHRRIRDRHVAIIGCGALGSNSADLLARSGIGRLTLIDADVLTEDNLQRVAVYRESAVGRPKAEALAEALRKTNHDVAVHAVVDRVRADNAAQLIAAADLVIDGLDNYASRYVVNEACVANRIPWVFGAVAAVFGMTMLIVPGAGACLRCLYPQPPDPDVVLTAGTSGLLASIARGIASLQVASALRWISHPDVARAGRLLFLDCWEGSLFEQSVTRNDRCSTCGRVAADPGPEAKIDAEALNGG